MLTITITDANGNVLHQALAAPREFKTGSKGYHTSGKVVVGGKKHQLGLNLVEVGSKDKA